MRLRHGGRASARERAGDQVPHPAACDQPRDGAAVVGRIEPGEPGRRARGAALAPVLQGLVVGQADGLDLGRELLGRQQ